jgi:hypothetical protein
LIKILNLDIDFSEEDQMNTRCNEFTEMMQIKPVQVEHMRVADARTAVEDSLQSARLAGFSGDDQSSAVESVHCQGINAMTYNRLV